MARPSLAMTVRARPRFSVHVPRPHYPERIELGHARGDLRQRRTFLLEPGRPRPPHVHHRDIEIERRESLAQHPGLARSLRREIAPQVLAMLVRRLAQMLAGRFVAGPALGVV